MKWFQKQKASSGHKAEAMTTPKVDFSFRIYWTKMTRRWLAPRRAEVRGMVRAITDAPEFDRNLIEKRYELPLNDIPETTHSGASLMALLDVLDALDAVEASEEGKT
jgi:hypothetical protein